MDPDDDNVDVQVTFLNGKSFFVACFILRNIDTLMKRYKKTGECTRDLYSGASDMILEKLTEKTIWETTDNLLAKEEFESIFTKNDEPSDISPEEGEKLFKDFDGFLPIARNYRRMPYRLLIKPER